MYDFILRLALVFSLAVIVYILARVVARLDDAEEQSPQESFFDRWLARIPVSKIDAWLHGAAGKFLRRLRVVVLKIDNFIHGHITRLKRAEEAAGESRSHILKGLDRNTDDEERS